MTTILDQIVGELVDAVFDGTGTGDPAVEAAHRFTEAVTNPKATRQAIAVAIADLTIAIAEELTERDLTVRQAAYRAATPRQVIDPRSFCRKPVFQPRKWRVVPVVPSEPENLNVTAALLGDPPPGRSAWDQKQGASQ